MERPSLNKNRRMNLLAGIRELVLGTARHGLRTRLGDRLVRRLNRRDIAAYRKAHSVHKLHLGCGERTLPRWLNADRPSLRHILRSSPALGMDCVNSLPLPIDSDSFDFAYSEHFHEHLPYQNGLRLLEETFRILKPNGRVRIAVPDLDFLFDMMRSDGSFKEYCEAQKDQIDHTEGLLGAPVNKTTFLNLMFRGFEHKYLYSRESLHEQLKRAGFVDIVTLAPGQSDFAELRGLETDPTARKDTLELHVSYTISFEGRKPASRGSINECG